MAHGGCEGPITLPGSESGSRGPCQDGESQATDSWQEGRVSSDMCSLKLVSRTSWPGAQVSLSQPQLPTSLPPTGLEPWRYRDLSSAPGAREREATCLRHTDRVEVPGGAPQERQVSFNPKPTGSPETILAG